MPNIPINISNTIDEFVVKKEITELQIQTAEELINWAEKYIETKI